MGRADRLFRLADRAGLEDDPQLQRLLGIAIATGNDRLLEQVERLLAAKAGDHGAYPFTDDPAEPPADAIDLGTSFTGSQFTVPEPALSKHLLVYGQSGAGKTTLLYNVLDEVSVPFWVFDLKRDFRHLARTDMDVLVVPWHQLRVNPLQPPPGVSMQRWAQVVAEVFGHSHGLLSASKNHFMSAVMDLYDQHTDDSERSQSAPTLHDLTTLLADNRPQQYTPSAQYHDRIQNRINALLDVAGPVFTEHYPLTDLLDRNVVFEFDGLRHDLQDFLMELLFAWVYEYRLSHGNRGTDLRHVFVLDEGKRVFSVYKERQDAAGLPHIDTITARMREFGEALLVADQEPTKLTDSIKANTFTTVLLPMGDATQFHEAAGSLHLSDRQRNYAQSLNVGQGIVQVGNDDPVPVQFPDFPIEKTVTDTELERRFAGTWQTLSASPSSPSSLQAGDTADEPEEPVQSTEQAADEADIDLSEAAESLLQDVVESPYRKLTDRYQALSMSRYRGNKAKKELLDAGIVAERTVEKKYGQPTLLELTDTGRAYLAEQGVEVSRRGRGGIVHRYWQHFLCDAFDEAGFDAEIEQDDADIGLEIGDARIAIEVAMTAADREVKHVRDRLSADFDQVVVGCRSSSVRITLKTKLSKAELDTDRVHVRLLQELQSAAADAKDFVGSVD